jgi:pimeloyl-ACP methyl ester carboxylesterase
VAGSGLIAVPGAGTSDLWREEGGAGDGAPILLMIHGLGATAEVWRGTIRIADERWPGRWIAPDLRGHGRSPWGRPYAFGTHATDVARLIGASDVAGGPVVVLGHSMGGVIGLALATRLFGVDVTAVVGVGVKVTWSEKDLEWIRASVARPVRWFETRQEAAERFLRLAGLPADEPPDGPLARSGVVEEDGRFRVAMDPAAPEVGPPPMEDLVARSTAAVRLACGEHDGLTSVADLRRFDPAAAELAGLGHNAHVDDPEAVWRLLASMTYRDAASQPLRDVFTRRSRPVH